MSTRNHLHAQSSGRDDSFVMFSQLWMNRNGCCPIAFITMICSTHDIWYVQLHSTARLPVIHSYAREDPMEPASIAVLMPGRLDAQNGEEKIKCGRIRTWGTDDKPSANHLWPIKDFSVRGDGVSASAKLPWPAISGGSYRTISEYILWFYIVTMYIFMCVRNVYLLFGCQLVADSLQGMVGFQSAGRLQLRCSQEEARTVTGERAVWQCFSSGNYIWIVGHPNF